MQNIIRIHRRDNVAVALSLLREGQKFNIDGTDIQIIQDIPAGHKFALADLKTGDEIIKYGFPIGLAVKPIQAGEWVHTHNIKTKLGEILNYRYEPENRIHSEALPLINRIGEGKERGDFFFRGYLREDGRAGTRNEIFIIPTVGCVNDIARILEKEGEKLKTEYVDAVAAFTHPYGCSQLGDDLNNTQKILADLINHPNAAGVLVIGLGCENNTMDDMKKQIGAFNKERVKFLICQEAEDEITEGIRLLKELMDYASGFRREELSVDKLVIGLKCGGSDGLSGITANPLVGSFSDLMIANGGTTLLTEVPEMFGAETILMNRCADSVLFDKTVFMINEFKKYFVMHNQPVYENPSPGNKKGGISTLEEKSLGCTQKSGGSKITGVLGYGDRAAGKGLQLLNAPGNDLVASTALAAAGAQIIMFTTGRGTPFAAPVPTIKISTNSTLAEMKSNWIDYDAGRLITGSSYQELSLELYRKVLSVASGEQVKSEKLGFHDLAIFKQGVTL